MSYYDDEYETNRKIYGEKFAKKWDEEEEWKWKECPQCGEKEFYIYWRECMACGYKEEEK
ncbi:MAG: hypothetical protein NC816_00720 [Candidatus Omnitrophica bacterium]|nr:hypothetical protein [Candidatus Omnitrophota bacterium]